MRIQWVSDRGGTHGGTRSHNISFRDGTSQGTPLGEHESAVIPPRAARSTQHNASAESVGRGIEPAPRFVVGEACTWHPQLTPVANPPHLIVGGHPDTLETCALPEGYERCHRAGAYTPEGQARA
jgi:hypothetical protein